MQPWSRRICVEGMLGPLREQRRDQSLKSYAPALAHRLEEWRRNPIAAFNPMSTVVQDNTISARVVPVGRHRDLGPAVFLGALTHAPARRTRWRRCGERGGVAAATWMASAALDAAGYDPILSETVGAGQSEIEIARLAETTVVVEVPEMGDEVQAIKAGLLEVADLLLANPGARPRADPPAPHLRALLPPCGGPRPRSAPPRTPHTAPAAPGETPRAFAVGQGCQTRGDEGGARGHAGSLLRGG